MPDAAASPSWPRLFGGMESAPTIAARMAGKDARTNAFDTIRLFAALTVIVSHAFLLTSGTYQAEPVFWASGGQTTMGSLAVGVFFVISGLFISASFDRSPTIGNFVSKRALRIMPALVVVTILLALVAGPAITTVPLADYFADAQTWTYFRNIAFLPMAVELPGVFKTHTLSTVNESIWTLKFEVACYAIAAIVLAIGRSTRTIVWTGWIASFFIVRYWPNANGVSGAEYYIVAIARMFRYFGAGMLIYLYRDRIVLHAGLAWLLAALTVASVKTPWFIELSAVFGAYPVIAFGYLAPRWFRDLTSRGDVSYGVYIYGWPVQQMLWTIGAGLSLHWLINAALALPIAYALGWASWLLVEKPAMRAKPQLRRSQPAAA